jgi:SAM-dependent methyltransferase
MTDWNSRSFHGTFNRYPFTEIVSFVLSGFGGQERSKVAILDLGCGGGSHLGFLAAEGFDYHGVDGNRESVTRANERLKALGFRDDRAVTADFAKLPYPDGLFDAVLDRGSVTCNEGRNIPPLLSEIRRVMKPGASLFSMILDVLAAPAAGGRHAGNGDFVDFPGRLAGAGLLHFTSPVEVIDLFSEFKIASVQRLTRTIDYPISAASIAESWVIVTAEKSA